MVPVNIHCTQPGQGNKTQSLKNSKVEAIATEYTVGSFKTAYSVVNESSLLTEFTLSNISGSSSLGRKLKHRTNQAST